jgi:hypothetical protein
VDDGSLDVLEEWHVILASSVVGEVSGGGRAVRRVRGSWSLGSDVGGLGLELTGISSDWTEARAATWPWRTVLVPLVAGGGAKRGSVVLIVEALSLVLVVPSVGL